MDIFNLDLETYDNGKIINGVESLLWVERYKKEGEFKIIGYPSFDFLSDLATGTLVSHTDTRSIMMVETHEIDESKEGIPKVTVVGRSIEQIAMENRVVTLSDHEDDPHDDNLIVYPLVFNLAEANAWEQVEILLDRYLVTSTYSVQERFPNLQVTCEISADDVEPLERELPRLSLVSDAVRDLLGTIDAGIKVDRINSTHPDWIEFVIHAGENKSATVQFNWFSGDLESARYIKSIKDYRNSAYVGGKFYGIRKFEPVVSGFDMRILPVDASDFEAEFASLPPLTQYYIFSVLGARAKSELNKHKALTMIDAKISKDNPFVYGRDYNIGDIVGVIGNYGVNTIMRVVEHAKVIDKDGEYGIPTLEPIE